MNGSQKLGVLGLYTLGATDIFAYLNDVIIELTLVQIQTSNSETIVFLNILWEIVRPT